MMQSIVYNADCLEAMRGMPDKAFDLAIVDPPYGIGQPKHANLKGYNGREDLETRLLIIEPATKYTPRKNQ